MKNMLRNDVKTVPNFIRIALSSKKKTHLKSVHMTLNEIINNESSFIPYKQYFLQCIDIIELPR